MNDPMTTSSHGFLMEIRSDEWRGQLNGNGFVISIQRDEQGHLTSGSVADVRQSVKKCLDSVSPHGLECVCAIGSGGLSLRAMNIPKSKESAIKSLLELQIEKEWPLPPEELSWGYVQIDQASGESITEDDSTSLVAVGAIKQSLFEHYLKIVSELGLKTQWTLSACASTFLPAAQTFKHCCIIDLRCSSTDIFELKGGVPISIQAMKWGWNDLKNSIQKQKDSSDDLTNDDLITAFKTEDQSLVHDWVKPLIERLNNQAGNYPVILTGEKNITSLFQSELQDVFSEREFQCHEVSASTVFPIHVFSEHSASLIPQQFMLLEAGDEVKDIPKKLHIPYIRWAAMLIVLGIVALLARRIEPTLRGAKLDAQLNDFREQKKKLPEIDRELSFLEHIQKNSVPYMDLVGLLAAKSVSGFRLETLEMGSDRRIQIRGALPQNAHPEDLRAKLLESGWFEQVVLDEQTPDKQKRNLTVRISILLKDHLRRPRISHSMLDLKPETGASKKSK